MRKARSLMPIPSENTGFRVGYLTDPGRQRNLNEDSFYVNEDIGLFIVADGMGGHNAGEVASSIAVTVVSNLIEEGLASTKDPVELVRRGMSNANETILEKSLNNTAWSEMGTTLLVALFTDHELVIGHVGDSRAYMIGKGRIRQLTQDHTFVAEWLREGRITKEQARRHHQRHGLTEALGVTKDVLFRSVTRVALIVILASATIVAVTYLFAWRTPLDFNSGQAMGVVLLA
ncbi:MAG: protein phosphatase 2C domain-containing protein, partial [Desulfomonilaceae bacterium]